jgi:hypothetical protein
MQEKIQELTPWVNFKESIAQIAKDELIPCLPAVNPKDLLQALDKHFVHLHLQRAF